MQLFFSRVQLAVFLFFTFAGLALKFIAARPGHLVTHKKAVGKFIRPFLSTGLVGLLLLFFESERVLFLRSRFWYLLLGAWFLYTLFRALEYLVKKMPKEKAALEKRARLEKYLPK